MTPDGALQGAPGGPPDSPGELRCSARGCRSAAVWALRWNNPKIHGPERRKTWLACQTHVDHLASFLSMRGMLRERCGVADLVVADLVELGPGTTAGPAA